MLVKANIENIKVPDINIRLSSKEINISELRKNSYAKGFKQGILDVYNGIRKKCDIPYDIKTDLEMYEIIRELKQMKGKDLKEIDLNIIIQGILTYFCDRCYDQGYATVLPFIKRISIPVCKNIDKII